MCQSDVANDNEGNMILKNLKPGSLHPDAFVLWLDRIEKIFRCLKKKQMEVGGFAYLLKVRRLI